MKQVIEEDLTSCAHAMHVRPREGQSVRGKYLKRVKKEFDFMAQANLVALSRKDHNYKVLNIVNVSTSDMDRIVKPSRDNNVLIDKFE